MKRIFLSMGFTLTAALPLLADLDEDYFKAYDAGDLLGQHGWSVEAPVNDTLAPTLERIEVHQKEADQPGKSIIWKSGFEQAFQARAVKRFPSTTSPRVEVVLSVYISEEPKGILYFDQPGIGSIKLFFIRGKVNVMSKGDDRGVSQPNYFKEDWTNIRLRLDFERHTAELILEDSPAVSFQIDPNMTELSQVNFFAGSAGAENRIGNLVVRSLEDRE